MKKFHPTYLFLLLIAGNVVLADDTGSDTWKEGVLRNYFAAIGFSIDPTKQSILYNYGDDVIKRMNDHVEQDANSADKYDLEAEINNMIYESEQKKAPQAEDCKPFEPADEVILRTLNLIVPDPFDDPDSEYPEAKKDLWRFYTEQPERAKELLNRVRGYLDAKDLHSDDAARLLRNFYYHWIPLARLEKFIEAKTAS